MTNGKQTEPTNVEHSDGFINLVTGLGNRNRDKRLSSNVDVPRLMEREELDNLYHGGDLARKIVESPAAAMIREWFEIQSEDPDLNDDTQKALEELRFKSLLFDAISDSRSYGSALMVLGIDDGQEVDQPLRETSMKTIKWIKVLDRYYFNTIKNDDINSENYGNIEWYEVQSANAGINQSVKIHHTRALRFDGTRTNRRRQWEYNNGWSDSIFVSIFEAVRAHGTVWSNSETLLADFAQAVFKLTGLSKALASGNDALIMQRMAMMDMSRSTLRALLLDDTEEFTRQATPLTGLPEMIDRFMYYLSAVTGIPVTVLFGRAPAGLNSTGESDIRNWYDDLVGTRGYFVDPNVERFLEILYLVKDGPTSGQMPKDWRVVWSPLWQLSDAERTDVRKAQMETDTGYIDRGVVTADEVALSRFGGTDYSQETMIEVEAREEPEPPADDEVDLLEE